MAASCGAVVKPSVALDLLWLSRRLLQGRLGEEGAPEECESWGTGQQESRALGGETGQGAGRGRGRAQRALSGVVRVGGAHSAAWHAGSVPGCAHGGPAVTFRHAGGFRLSVLGFGESLAECWGQRHTDRWRSCLQSHSQVEPDMGESSGEVRFVLRKQTVPSGPEAECAAGEGRAQGVAARQEFGAAAGA